MTAWGTTAVVVAVAWVTGPTVPGTLLALLTAVVAALTVRWARLRPAVGRDRAPQHRTARRGVPVARRLGAAALLLLTFPLLAGVAVAIRLRGPGPVLTRDPGIGPPPGRLRFRAGPAGLLHSLWLDELPHLLDVVRGRGRSHDGDRP